MRREQSLAGFIWADALGAMKIPSPALASTVVTTTAARLILGVIVDKAFLPCGRPMVLAH
jgi:hypothetical protein